MFSFNYLIKFYFAFVYLFISHGSLPLYKCFTYIIFYSTAVFGLYQMKHTKHYVFHKENP